MAQKKYAKAFTLVELMVVVAIIGITSTIVVVSLVNTRLERQVLGASQKIAAVIRAAQNDALTGRSTGSTEKNCWYGVDFDAINGNHYAVISFYKDGSPAACNTGTMSNKGDYFLDSGVIISARYSKIIGFSLPRGEVLYLNGVVNPPTGSMNSLSSIFTVEVSKSGYVAYVCIYPGGRIEESGVGQSCP